MEFALLLPVLILILCGILDLGRLYFAAITISNAAREGARYGMDHTGNFDDIRARVRAEAAGSGIDLSDPALATIDPSCPNACARLTPIRVVVTYNLRLIVPGVFGFDTVPVRSYAEMMIP